MKKTKIVSVVLVTMILVAIVFTANSVFAAEDLTGSLLGNSTTNNTTNNTVDNSTNNTTLNTTNSTVNKTTNNTAVLTTNNTSTYNNTSLPKTGVADSMPVAILVVVLGISGLYAYKKMQEYKHI